MTSNALEKRPLVFGPLGFAVLSLATALGLVVLHWDGLPEPMATHWGLNGRPDGAMTRVGFLVFSALAVLPFVWFVAAAKTRATAVWAGAAAFMGCGMLVGVAWSVVQLNRGANEWRQVPSFPWSHLLVVLIAPALLSALYVWTQRKWLRVAPDIQPPQTLPLQPQQRAMWTNRASNPWLWLGVTPVVLSVGFLFTRGPLAATWVTLAVSLVLVWLLELLSTLRVRVDQTGVTIFYGHLGWVKQHIKLTDISRADAFDLIPLKHGGWGYRGNLSLFKRVAIVVRAGEAIRLALSGGRQLTVTVNDAQTGAKLINGLIAQARGDGSTPVPAKAGEGRGPLVSERRPSA